MKEQTIELPPVEKIMVIEYDVMNGSLYITQNDFTPFEAMGILEIAKLIVARELDLDLSGDDDGATA